MSVLVFIEHNEGKIKKSSHEALTYASKLGGEIIALSLGEIDNSALENLGAYGAKKVLKVNYTGAFDSQVYTQAIAHAAEQENADTVILSFSYTGKSVAPRLSVRMKAGLIPGASALPSADGSIKKGVFSGKAYANYKINTAKKIITLTPNSIPVEKGEGSAEVVDFNVSLPEPKVQSKEVQKASGKIPLTEAELVVSAGRGLKGPENWGMIEEMAEILGAGTACSRPVSDMDWRPHGEHVGQTGITIRPNLYIAVGISGAIQHLAGVNQSKVIVVINKDSEAPFFKAADYGIVGDAFEVIPKLNEALKTFKAASV